MKIAISVGDINGIGIEIALRSHESIKSICHPIYIINKDMLKEASKLLNIKIPSDFHIYDLKYTCQINPSIPTKESGLCSYKSFIKACELADKKEVEAITTLPINKFAWNMANIEFKGHTDLLAHRYKKDAIMMLGCDEMFVALFTHHIPLKDVPSMIEKDRLYRFFIDFYNSVKEMPIGVLGLNPHAGDDGVIGDEESIINEAVLLANKELNKEIFTSALVPDTAFSKSSRDKIKYFVAMYHDQGLIPLKALYFDKSINVSLNLPIIRTSVDHGTAYDIAYKGKNPSNLSYINAIKEAVKLAQKRKRFMI